MTRLFFQFFGFSHLVIEERRWQGTLMHFWSKSRNSFATKNDRKGISLNYYLDSLFNVPWWDERETSHVLQEKNLSPLTFSPCLSDRNTGKEMKRKGEKASVLSKILFPKEMTSYWYATFPSWKKVTGTSPAIQKVLTLLLTVHAHSAPCTVITSTILILKRKWHLNIELISSSIRNSVARTR